MKIFKRSIIFAVLLAVVITFTMGCSNAIIRFENDMADVDAKARMQWSLFIYKNNEATFYTEEELKALIQDISFIAKETKEEENICNLYISAAQKLISAIDKKNDDYYDRSMADFVKAQEEYDRYIYKAY